MNKKKNKVMKGSMATAEQRYIHIYAKIMKIG